VIYKEFIIVICFCFGEVFTRITSTTPTVNLGSVVLVTMQTLGKYTIPGSQVGCKMAVRVWWGVLQ